MLNRRWSRIPYERVFSSSDPTGPRGTPKRGIRHPASLVLGILGLVCFGLFTGIPAVICGHTAQSRIRRSAGALTGEGLALGGLITGYISIALSVLMIPLLVAIAIPNFVKAREVAQRNACINNLRQIDGGIQQWARELSKPDDAVPTVEDIKGYWGSPVLLYVSRRGNLHAERGQ